MVLQLRTLAGLLLFVTVVALQTAGIRAFGSDVAPSPPSYADTRAQIVAKYMQMNESVAAATALVNTVYERLWSDRGYSNMTEACPRLPYETAPFSNFSSDNSTVETFLRYVSFPGLELGLACCEIALFGAPNIAASGASSVFTDAQLDISEGLGASTAYLDSLGQQLSIAMADLANGAYYRATLLEHNSRSTTLRTERASAALCCPSVAAVTVEGGPHGFLTLSIPV